MSRGALLLRCVREQRELNYIPAASIPTSRPNALKLSLSVTTAIAQG
jgi:hypothetical protein